MRLLHSGHVLTGQALLKRNPSPSRADIVDAISGNICRCTGYGQIIEAIELSAERLRGRNLSDSVSAEPTMMHRDIGAQKDAPERGIIKAAEYDLPHEGKP